MHASLLKKLKKFFLLGRKFLIFFSKNKFHEPERGVCSGTEFYVMIKQHVNVVFCLRNASENYTRILHLN